VKENLGAVIFLLCTLVAVYGLVWLMLNDSEDDDLS
jgi:hypothetical protein